MQYGSESERRLEALMEQYGTSLLRTCAMILGDADLARDAVQETFIRAYRHIEEYRGEASEKTWLTAIAVNCCRDQRRRAWFRHRSHLNLDTMPEIPSDFAFPDSTVMTEVMHLPEAEREVILLRFYQEMKLKEIAKALGISEGRVRRRLDRAEKKLRDRLEAWYDEKE